MPKKSIIGGEVFLKKRTGAHSAMAELLSKSNETQIKDKEASSVYVRRPAPAKRPEINKNGAEIQRRAPRAATPAQANAQTIQRSTANEQVMKRPSASVQTVQKPSSNAVQRSPENVRKQNNQMKKLKIGNIALSNPYILAPMAGVTDLPFRLLCKEQGAGLLCMEMVSAKAIQYNNKNTKALLEIHPEEEPVSLQLFGSDPEVISEVAKQIEELPFAILDINMGCPVPKIVRNGEGSALMNQPKLVHEIVSKTVKAIQKPVTVKIRKGFNDESINAVEIAKIIEDAGGAAVAVHGRTREQYYSGKADWDIIRQVKEAVSIPVIGNGDVTSGESALAMMLETGCDGVMIGRGAQGNPWIFSELREYEKTGQIPARPSNAQLKEMMLRHARLQMQYKGDFLGIREMRKHVAWYTTGLPNSARLRGEINAVESYEELEKLLEDRIPV